MGIRPKEIFTSTRAALLACVRAFPGGMDAMGAAVGMSGSSLDNRLYERKEQRIHLDTALAVQAASGTTYLAEAVATLSGGVFVPLPDAEVCRTDLLAKFNELYAELGELSATFRAATADDEISPAERRALEAEAQRIHSTVEQLLALSFSVYCRPGVGGTGGDHAASR